MTGQNLLTKTLRSNRVAVAYEEDKARRMLKKVLSQPLLPFEYGKVMEHARSYLGGWFVGQLAQRYAALSPQIFERKRKIAFEDKELIVPLLFKVGFHEAKNLHRAEITIAHEGTDRFGGRSTIEYKVSAEVPSLPIRAREKYVEALQFNVGVTKQAYEDPLFARILASDRQLPTPYDAKFTLVWAPEELKVNAVTPQPRDPALIMTYWDKAHFLIHKWNAPREYSLDSMLNEFCESFPKPQLT